MITGLPSSGPYSLRNRIGSERLVSVHDARDHVISVWRTEIRRHV